MDKYNHWLGKMFGHIFDNGKPYAVTLWGITYYSCFSNEVSLKWRKHENCHQAQQRADGMFKFLTVYIWQWVTRGFEHDKISYETEAREAEK